MSHSLMDVTIHTCNSLSVFYLTIFSEKQLQTGQRLDCNWTHLGAYFLSKHNIVKRVFI